MPRPPAKESEDRLIMPVNLEGLRFWLTIMQEHAVFIRAFLPAENRDLRDEAQRFCQAFGTLLTRAERVQSSSKFRELASETEVLVKDFYRFNRRLLQMSLAGNLCGALYPLFLDHLSREAAYFLLLLQSVCAGKQPYGVMSQPEEILFWVRLMGDHGSFLRQMLDPSERSLICTAEEFAREFDGLYLQGTDYISILRGGNIVPSFTRYTQDTRVASQRMRDFNRALYNMINDNRVLSIIPALMADHMRREADHFLLTLAMIEKKLASCPDIAADAVLTGSILQPLLAPESALGVPIVPSYANAAASTVSANLKAKAKASMKAAAASALAAENAAVTPAAFLTIDDEDEDDDRINDIEAQAPDFPPDPEPEPEPVAPKVSGDKKKDSATVAKTKADSSTAKKHKWNSVWPNPLGFGKKT
ncbi:DUF2935 domain-containing protein [Acetonema longum]|uniref:DUF2935 domain-containing protein n=1 Tax=Acetonema longum DSM 6540 TaxID=1009370 RepID=F7NL13_9FIRM|nr:DUF2935 domain-containing protein [Acetonema longum]EGO63269.1 hypothetical protein ALO_13927 [Acetonema longum DSM 6540]